MTTMASDCVSTITPTITLSTTDSQHTDNATETWTTVDSGGFTVPPPPVATEARLSTDRATVPKAGFQTTQMNVDNAFSQSDTKSVDGSQASNATASDQVFTPTEDDTALHPIVSSHESQLLQLSELTAKRQKIQMDSISRKRTADGEVKDPSRGHARTTSAVSITSNASTIGDMASTLKRRLSWAAYKYRNGWEDKSMHEIESIMPSQSTSPNSTTSILPTSQPQRGSSASPQHRVHFAHVSSQRPRPGSPPPQLGNHPILAPPASIQPSAALENPRRSFNARPTPNLQTSHSDSPTRSPSQHHLVHEKPSRSQHLSAAIYSPRHNTREQDAVETLMFLSSPNNSANLRHTFSPAGSPYPSSQPPSRSNHPRHALPNGPRKTLPASRLSRSSMSQLQSAILIDAPQAYSSRESSRKRVHSERGHFKSALSLDALMGRRGGRKPLSDKDVLKMLDRDPDPMDVSSDDEEIQLPR